MKHAASVHPEPGSNSPLSEKFMSLVHPFRWTARLRCQSVRFIFLKINRYISSSAILLSMFYFHLRNLKLFLFSSSEPLFGSLTIRFQFPMSFTSVLRHFLCYHLNFLCQHLFLKSFWFLLRFQKLALIPFLFALSDFSFCSKLKIICNQYFFSFKPRGKFHYINVYQTFFSFKPYFSCFLQDFFKKRQNPLFLGYLTVQISLQFCLFLKKQYNI